ncbi:MAG TPA: T9SS type A sorting domain-containing protein, partial [Candidatus Marinimicrobia bacterium]|nr:T9SS type A sorting domain-containing protein [Candidatus Neomarinimicrobiota bacterium]
YTGNGNYYLTDISGKVIQQNSIENNVNSFNIDVNDIANGTYLLAIEINGNVSTSKVVIVR